jgi:hypothetical protein
VPLAMLLTFIAGIGGLILPGMATIVGLPATWTLNYMVNVINYLANLSWASIKIGAQWWAIAIYYLLLVSACIYMWRVTKYNLRETNLVE